MLDHMNLAAARLLVIAIPDPIATRHIAEEARRRNPELAIIARTHSEEERAYVSGGHVDEAVLGERELALTMSRLALREIGVTADENQDGLGSGR